MTITSTLIFGIFLGMVLTMLCLHFLSKEMERDAERARVARVKDNEKIPLDKWA